MAGFQERLGRDRSCSGNLRAVCERVLSGPAGRMHSSTHAVLREGLGDYDKALASFAGLHQGAGRKKTWPTFSGASVLIHEKKKDYKAMQSHFAEFSRSRAPMRPPGLCRYKVVQAYLKQNREKEAKAGYEGSSPPTKKLGDADRIKPAPSRRSPRPPSP